VRFSARNHDGERLKGVPGEAGKHCHFASKWGIGILLSRKCVLAIIRWATVVGSSPGQVKSENMGRNTPTLESRKSSQPRLI